MRAFEDISALRIFQIVYLIKIQKYRYYMPGYNYSLNCAQPQRSKEYTIARYTYRTYNPLIRIYKRKIEKKKLLRDEKFLISQINQT